MTAALILIVILCFLSLSILVTALVAFTTGSVNRLHELVAEDRADYKLSELLRAWMRCERLCDAARHSQDYVLRAQQAKTDFTLNMLSHCSYYSITLDPSSREDGDAPST